MSLSVTLDRWAQVRGHKAIDDTTRQRCWARLVNLVFDYYLRDLRMAAINNSHCVLDTQLQLIATELVQDALTYVEKQKEGVVDKDPAADLELCWYRYRNCLRMS